MNKEELKERFKRYALNTAFLILKLPYNIVNKNYSDQINRSASSAAANYRAALRGKSRADFLNKFKIVEEELDESLFFFELIQEINPSYKEAISKIYKEGNELLSIIVASLNTMKNNRNREIVNPKS
ncbi:MAG TPA: four helix bundle protein [Puia sp.]|nr:four helix bundle protein [Puia sp.]